MKPLGKPASGTPGPRVGGDVHPHALRGPEPDPARAAAWSTHLKQFPWNPAGRSPDYAEIRRRVLRLLRRPSLFPLVEYDFVLVDEGQDLDRTSFDILRTIFRHVTVGIDHKRQIYEGGSAEEDILAGLGLRHRNMNLLEAFRCCPFIINLSSELISDPKEKEEYKRQSRTYQTEREMPLFYLATPKGSPSIPF